MKENYRALLQDNKIQRQRREQIQEKNVKTIQKERKKKKGKKIRCMIQGASYSTKSIWQRPGLGVEVQGSQPCESLHKIQSKQNLLLYFQLRFTAGEKNQ